MYGTCCNVIHLIYHPINQVDVGTEHFWTTGDKLKPYVSLCFNFRFYVETLLCLRSGLGTKKHLVILGEDQSRLAFKVHIKWKAECYLLPHIHVLPVQTFRLGAELPVNTAN